MTQRIDTIIVGGGQAGLSTSYYLKLQGREHLILERASRPAHVWRDGRWDSFTLVTPNWTFRLPGAEYQGDDPDGFMGRDEIVEIFEQYVLKYQLPIRYNTSVTSVEPHPGGVGYLVTTDDTTYHANHVVIATGLFQKPRIPSYASKLTASVRQLHSGDYKNPSQLPPGGVLVVGSSQSGCQIADELLKSGRSVYLCVGHAGRAPRRYRGKDGSEWLDLLGLSDRTVDQLPSPQAKFAANPHISGKKDAQNLNLHRFAKDGMSLLGTLQDADEFVLKLAPDLNENLAKADKFEADFLKNIDNYIEKHQLDLPLETLPQLRDGYQASHIEQLDLRAAGISTIIWAIGYTSDFSIVKLPVLDCDGFPIQQRGVTQFPGLYFVGLPWLYKQKSGLLSGVGDDAAYLASTISAKSSAECLA
jgi:putative flavoprotein involved in K+ transport